MNMVCEVDLPSVSVSDCEIVEPQTFFVQKAWRQRCAVVRTAQENDSQHGSDALPVDASKGGALVPQELSSITDKRSAITTKATWPGPPREVGPKPRSDHIFRSRKASDCEFDAVHIWNPQERVITRGM